MLTFCALRLSSGDGNSVLPGADRTELPIKVKPLFVKKGSQPKMTSSQVESGNSSVKRNSSDSEREMPVSNNTTVCTHLLAFYHYSPTLHYVKIV